MSKVTFKNMVEPVRRNLKFRLSKEDADNWNPAGVPFTQFMNSLSIFFPAGERFFIDSIRNYRDDIKDEQLKKEIHQFIGQEAMHTREHLVYNQALIDAGFPVDVYMNRVEKLLKNVQRFIPQHVQLAVTMALEHLTASLGEVLLKDPALMEGAEENFKNVWLWHAMEEIEHKGVAFDVWNSVMPNNLYTYTVRVVTHIIAHLVFWSLVIPFHINLVRKSNKKSGVKGWYKCFQYLWTKPGALRKIMLELVDYFRPGFHPWQNDNRYLFNNIDEFAKEADLNYEKSAA